MPIPAHDDSYQIELQEQSWIHDRLTTISISEHLKIQWLIPESPFYLIFVETKVHDSILLYFPKAMISVQPYILWIEQNTIKASNFGLSFQKDLLSSKSVLQRYEENKSRGKSLDLPIRFFSFLVHNAPNKATDLVRKCPKFPRGSKWEAFPFFIGRGSRVTTMDLEKSRTMLELNLRFSDLK